MDPFGCVKQLTFQSIVKNCRSSVRQDTRCIGMTDFDKKRITASAYEFLGKVWDYSQDEWIKFCLLGEQPPKHRKSVLPVVMGFVGFVIPGGGIIPALGGLVLGFGLNSYLNVR